MPNPVPDWYPDPYDASAQRWWDGLQWTAHTRNILLAAPSGPFSNQPYYAPAAPEPSWKRSTGVRLFRLNRVGFIGAALGVISCLDDVYGVIALAAVVLTIIGLVKDRTIRKSGERRTGRMWLIFTLCVASFMFLLRLFFTIAGLPFAVGMPI